MIGNKRNGRLSGRTRLALTGTAMAGALAASVLVAAPAHAGDRDINCIDLGHGGARVCVAFTDIGTAHGWMDAGNYNHVLVELSIQRSDGRGYATTSNEAGFKNTADTWSFYQTSSACAKGYKDTGSWYRVGQACLSR